MRTAVDVLVVGAGPAGLSCATALVRRGIDVVLVDGLAPGGELANLANVEGYPAVQTPIPGSELAAAMLDEALDAGVRFDYLFVEKLLRGDEGRWHANDGALDAAAVVVATGSEADIEAISGAAPLLGRGVSVCASCDGPLFRGKSVAVVGSGRDAIYEAGVLAGHAERVLIVGDWTDPVAVGWRSRLPESPVVSLVDINGVVAVEPSSSGLRLLAAGEEHEVDGVFVATPRRPALGLLEVTPPVSVDATLHAGSGAYVIGDARGGSSWSVAGAIGDAATAADRIATELVDR